jgi:NADH dehydrogenase [ubiquinone] 1 alpha subcomplex assembly factor 1
MFSRRQALPAFVATVVALLMVAGPVLMVAGPAHALESRLVDFTPREPRWIAVNDGVMGGVSSGGLVVAKGIATFTGRVRLENNGGFSSIRSSGSVGSLPSGTKAFSLRVRGATTYQFTVDTDAGWYWATIRPAKNTWSTVTVDFADLVAVSRFGEPEDREPFDGSQEIGALGFLISNKRAEKFSLSVDWIAASTVG